MSNPATYFDFASQNLFRYRCWHKELKTMLYPPMPYDSMTMCRDTWGNHRKTSLKDPITHHIQEHYLYAHFTWDGRWYVNGSYQDVVWMKSLQIPDYRNIEIYEGDIVVFFQAMDSKYSAPYEISWNKSRFGFELKTPDELSIDNWGRIEFASLENFPNQQVTVIGNVWETPDKLNKPYDGT